MELLPGESCGVDSPRLPSRYRHNSVDRPSNRRGLTAVHRVGFLHADIKPENIRLVDDGTAVLIDLGFAHKPGENVSLLKQGYVPVLPITWPRNCGFLPETDLSSDIFSLGVTLFEMITGRLPYPTGSVDETMAATTTIRLPISEAMASPCPKRWPVSFSACCPKNQPTDLGWQPLSSS